MTNDSNEFTLTMARVYAGQGHWKKAVEIYRYLAAAQPGRSDLQDALQAAEERLAQEGAKRLEDLAPLLRTWLKLRTRVDQLEKLKRIKS